MAFIVMAQAMLASVVMLVFLAMPVVAQRQMLILLPIKQHKVELGLMVHSDKEEVIQVVIIIDTALPAVAAAGMAEDVTLIVIPIAKNWFMVTVEAPAISNRP